MEYITAFGESSYLSDSGTLEQDESRTKQTTNFGTDLINAKETYRKQLSACKVEEEAERIRATIEEIDARIKDRDEREIIESGEELEPREIPLTDGTVAIGPPTLTRFEKARIMGARALQLSLGAPPFIAIPSTATTSLDIAMEELELRAIPIIIRRVLPNGNYQNIPISVFC